MTPEFAPSNAAQPLILVVDDDPKMVHLLAKIVREFGDVIFATSGADAVGMVAERRPDLVLLDAEMAGMNGFDACRAIKAEPENQDLPVLFVTAHNGVDQELAALAAGAVDFITKPPSPPIVQARVRTHLVLKRRTDELRRVARTDGLTGLANRRSLDTALDQEWRRARRHGLPLSLIMIDVDFFKRYNDHYGHQAGDDCLRRVASVLADSVRRAGDVAARFGGEEFVIVLPGCDGETAGRAAEKLRATVAALAIPHAGSDVAPGVSISLGVATIAAAPAEAAAPTVSEPSGEDTVEGLIRAADQALYRAKSIGRNRVAAIGLTWAGDAAPRLS